MARTEEKNHQSSAVLQCLAYWDRRWQADYQCALHEIIYNSGGDVQDISRLSAFCTPDKCRFDGRLIVFNLRADMERFQNIARDTLQKLGFDIRASEIKSAEADYKWFDMTDQQRVGFAKAIWAKRPSGRYLPEIQALLCRLAGAPSPDTLNQLLLSSGIDPEGVTSN